MYTSVYYIFVHVIFDLFEQAADGMELKTCDICQQKTMCSEIDTDNGTWVCAPCEKEDLGDEAEVVADDNVAQSKTVEAEPAPLQDTCLCTPKHV